MKHIFFIDNDKLICQKFRSLYTGNVNTYKCVFRIKSDVQGLTWFCVFKHGDLIRQTEIVNNSCMIPHELLSNKGTLSIGCYAVNPDENNYKRISTGWVNINLKTGAYSEATAPDIPSPDVWETLILKSVPYIGDNGNWFIYSLEENKYIDSGVSASGGGGGSPVDAYTKSETDKLLDSKENISNKTTELTQHSTDEQYPTARAVNERFETVEDHFNIFVGVFDSFQNQMDNVNTTLDNKADKTTTTPVPDYITSGGLTFKGFHNRIYRYLAPAMEQMTFYFENAVYEEDYTAELSFNSGETPTTITYADTGILNWLGTDCSLQDGLSIFAPTANKHYDIVFYFNGTCFVGLVNGFEMATVNNEEIENREA